MFPKGSRRGVESTRLFIITGTQYIIAGYLFN